MRETTNKTRTPKQNRSKARVESILTAAKSLIEEKGSAQVKIQEIAKKAKVSVSSMYQYFPDKNAIIHALFEQYLQKVRSLFSEYIVEINSVADLSHNLGQLLDNYYQLYYNEPVFRDIVAIGEADKRMQDIDIEDSQQNATIIFEAAQHLVPEEKREDLKRYLFLMMHLTNGVVQLATYWSKKDVEEAKKMVEVSKNLVAEDVLQKFFK
ncbi:MAG TPA: TetR family transcriptional regulator [Microscillaceae bacterium]|nr:TetR family transcriptional regulator [Microscillaceae bacterium]